MCFIIICNLGQRRDQKSRTQPMVHMILLSGSFKQSSSQQVPFGSGGVNGQALELCPRCELVTRTPNRLLSKHMTSLQVFA